MPKPAKIYTQADWNAADLMTRFHIHMLEPYWKLTLDEESRLNVLKGAWHAIQHFPAGYPRIKYLEDNFQVTSAKAGVLLRDAVTLFGDYDKINLELELRLSYERYRALAQKAADEGDYDTSRKCEESADKIALEIDRRKPKQTRQYEAIVLTDDPTAIRPRNEDFVTDIEFENVEEVHISE